jgi:hypothetical protein
MNLCRLLPLIEKLQNTQNQKADLERLRRENKNIFPPTFLQPFHETYTYYAYDVVLKKYETAMNHCKFDEEVYQRAVDNGLPFHPEREEVLVIQEIQVQKKGETVPRTVKKQFKTTCCTCSCQFLTNTGLPCEHIIFFCKKLMGLGQKEIWEHLPVDVIKVDQFWKKRVPVVLLDDDDDDDENPNPNPTDDDDYDTILDIKTDDDFTRKEKLEHIRKSFYNKCDGLIENCSTGVLLSFVNHMNRCVDEYVVANSDAFPNADKVFHDEKTNRPYTAPQRNRGGGGRDSTKRKESAAALGRKAAAKKAKKSK